MIWKQLIFNSWNHISTLFTYIRNSMKIVIPVQTTNLIVYNTVNNDLNIRSGVLQQQASIQSGECCLPPSFYEKYYSDIMTVLTGVASRRLTSPYPSNVFLLDAEIELSLTQTWHDDFQYVQSFLQRTDVQMVIESQPSLIQKIFAQCNKPAVWLQLLATNYEWECTRIHDTLNRQLFNTSESIKVNLLWLYHAGGNIFMQLPGYPCTHLEKQRLIEQYDQVRHERLQQVLLTCNELSPVRTIIFDYLSGSIESFPLFDIISPTISPACMFTAYPQCTFNTCVTIQQPTQCPSIPFITNPIQVSDKGFLL